MSSQDHPEGQLFGVFQSSRPPDAGVAPRLNIGAENWNFLKLLKTMIVGGSLILSGSPEHKETLIFLNYGVMAPKAGRENDPNLPIT